MTGMIHEKPTAGRPTSGGIADLAYIGIFLALLGLQRYYGE